MKKYNTLNEVKSDVDKGITVHWSNSIYVVKKEEWSGHYLCWCTVNGWCGGNIDNDDVSKFYSE